LSGVVELSVGYYHWLALRGDGSVWSWGNNDYGQLGDGSDLGRSTPRQVPGLSGVVAISAGIYDSLALRDDGTVWSWGYNGQGQLGDGTITHRSTPVQVPGLRGVTAVSAASSFYSLALRDDGTVWTWGANALGQLGDGTRTSRPTPGQVPGLSGVVALSAGFLHVLALHGNGSVWTWGYNVYGQLGDGTRLDRPAPAQVSGSIDGAESGPQGIENRQP
jgi:alpha-tubulin suppressor-like RCC1 family protein